MSKILTTTLLDGDFDGRVSVEIEMQSIVVYKTLRQYLEPKEGDKRAPGSIENAGIYLLFGPSHEDGYEQSVYIGQADVRKNGNGMAHRILESHNAIDDWTEVIFLTTSNNVLGPTELNYLEYKFYQLAKTANRFKVTNASEPRTGNITSGRREVLQNFIADALLIVGMLKNRVFEIKKKNKTLSPQPSKPTKPQVQSNKSSSNLKLPFNTELTYSTRSFNATCRYDEKGYTLLKGSTIAPRMTPTCSESIRKIREASANLVVNDTLQRDIRFQSPSGAAGFVSGRSTSGYCTWKTRDGKTLKKLLVKSRAL